MNELPEVENFLRLLPGFDDLDERLLNTAARAITVAYYRRGSDIMRIGSTNDQLHIVRSGAVELRNDDGDLITRLAEGEVFGFPSLMNSAAARNHSQAIEDTLIYHLQGTAFMELRRANQSFDTYFIRALSDRLLSQPTTQTFNGTAGASVATLINRSPITIETTASIRETAQKMVRDRVSAMLVTDEGRLRGIVTDRDFRSRVVAKNLAIEDSISSIMTPNPTLLDGESLAYEAALLMMQENIHHLPITNGDKLLGMVSRSDFMRLETEHPLYLVSDLGKQSSASGLADVCSRLPALIAGQINSDANGEHLGKFITAITDTVTRQLLRIAESELGSPPCSFAWIALGSQARHEQSAKSDQDNALILERAISDEEDEYFSAMAKIVNDGLDACGYVYCPGDVMASNIKWRQPLTRWKQYFQNWISVPEQKALMHANIFFDLRCIAGESGLADELKASVRSTARKSEIFLAMMAKNALDFQPPLGFFRQFVLEKSGEHRNTLNLKLHGIIPIVEIARIRSLAAGEMRVSTRNRLRAAAASKEITASDAASLIDALDFIEKLRLEHQSRQMTAGLAPDNHLSPSELSPLVRQNLKAAFSQVSISQSALLHRFHIA
jgi:CBS domain-containing protein